MAARRTRGCVAVPADAGGAAQGEGTRIVSAPALRADPEYLKAFASILAKIESALGKRRGREPVAVFVAGGAAMHLYTGARISKDIDATIGAKMLLPDDLQASYRDADGHAHLLYFDRQYNDSFALMHQDAHEDARSIVLDGVDPKRLDVKLLAPVDLAVSKLARFVEHDQDDIRALARFGLIDAKSLRERAREALPDYVGDLKRVENSIDIACRIVEKDARR
jgi:hypothetical protein